MIDPGIKGTDVLKWAAEMKIEYPVVFLLNGDSEQARRIAKDPFPFGIEGDPLQRDHVRAERLSAYCAAALLRKHGGEGGAYVAELLKQQILEADYGLVEFMKEGIGFACFVNEEMVFSHATPYDRVERLGPRAGELLDDPIFWSPT